MIPEEKEARALLGGESISPAELERGMQGLSGDLYAALERSRRVRGRTVRILSLLLLVGIAAAGFVRWNDRTIDGSAPVAQSKPAPASATPSLGEPDSSLDPASIEVAWIPQEISYNHSNLEGEYE